MVCASYIGPHHIIEHTRTQIHLHAAHTHMRIKYVHTNISPIHRRHMRAYLQRGRQRKRAMSVIATIFSPIKHFSECLFTEINSLNTRKTVSLIKIFVCSPMCRAMCVCACVRMCMGARMCASVRRSFSACFRVDVCARYFSRTDEASEPDAIAIK